MASIRKERAIDARPDDAWAALGDFGALHWRLPVIIQDVIRGECMRLLYLGGG